MSNQKERIEMNRECSWLDSLFRRYSCRTFSGEKLPEEMKKKVVDFCKETIQSSENEYIPSNEEMKRIRIDFHEFSFGGNWFTGDVECLAIIGPKSLDRIGLSKAGFIFQKVILYLTTLGIQTCWVGGRKFTKLLDEHIMKIQQEETNEEKTYEPLKEDEQVICMSPIGLSTGRKLIERIAVWMIGGRTRISSKKLFFENDFTTPLNFSNFMTTTKEEEKEEKKKMETVFEAFRWAPSAVNKQKWRIVKMGNEYHFYTYPSSRFYTNIDIGIAIQNWEIACKEQKIAGHLIRKEEKELNIPKIPGKDAIYFMTWVKEEEKKKEEGKEKEEEKEEEGEGEQEGEGEGEN